MKENLLLFSEVGVVGQNAFNGFLEAAVFFKGQLFKRLKNLFGYVDEYGA